MTDKIYIEIVSQEEFRETNIKPLHEKLDKISIAQNSSQNPLLTTIEMYKHLGIGRSKFLEHLYKGEIPAYRIGNLWRFDCEEVVKAFKINYDKSFKNKI